MDVSVIKAHNNHMKFKVFYADTYEVPLPDKHRFPMDKYRLIREGLIAARILSEDELFEAPLADENLIKSVHCPNYFEAIKNQTLEHRKARKVGLPLTPEMFQRTLGSMGGFLAAVEESLKDGFSASLSGGTHHAHYDSGEGFCFFNDFAVAVNKILQLRPQSKILILDLDVHQGNGNATMLKDNPNAYVISFHGKKNYPFIKPDSDMDVEFVEGTSDDEYLSKLNEVLENLPKDQFTHLLYQAGTDSLFSDSFGSLKLTFNGLKSRDQMVFEFAKNLEIPTTMALGGGYADPITDTVQATLNTYRTAKKVFS